MNDTGEALQKAIFDLTREAMGSGIAWLTDNMDRLRSASPDESLFDVMGDWPERFLGIRGDLTSAIEDAAVPGGESNE